MVGRSGLDLLPLNGQLVTTSSFVRLQRSSGPLELSGLPSLSMYGLRSSPTPTSHIMSFSHSLICKPSSVFNGWTKACGIGAGPLWYSWTAPCHIAARLQMRKREQARWGQGTATESTTAVRKTTRSLKRKPRSEKAAETAT